MAKDRAARLLRELKKRDPEHFAKLACGYGAHSFKEDVPYFGYKTCVVCGACYVTPKLWEDREIHPPTLEEIEESKAKITEMLKTLPLI